MKNPAFAESLRDELDFVRLVNAASKFENVGTSLMYQGASVITSAFIRKACYESGIVKREQEIKSAKVVVLNVFDINKVPKDQAFEVNDQLHKSMEKLAEIFGGKEKLIEDLDFLEELRLCSSHLYEDSTICFLKLLKGYVHNDTSDFYSKFEEYKRAYEKLIVIDERNGDIPKVNTLINFEHMMAISSKLVKNGYVLLEYLDADSNK